MEKYRKFDDASCGINPFVPLPEAQRSTFVQFLRMVLSLILLVIKVPFILLLLIVLLFLNFVKYFIVIPLLIRMLERLFNYCTVKMMLSAFSVNTIRATYHPDHKDFDFIKNEKGELSVKDTISGGDIIISNNVSLIDYLFLELCYAPLYTQVAINRQSGKFGFRVIGMLEVLRCAIGIRFPQEVDNGSFYDNLETLIASQKIKRPIVLFPEATKTNGRGILNFEPEIVDIILAAAESGRVKIHTIRFDYDYQFTSPYNSTDPLGLKSALKLLTQLRNSILIQYYFNVEEKLQELKSREEKYAFIRKTMMARTKEYALQLTFREHQQFLDYWFNTQNKFYANQSKKNK
eukprot:403366042